MLKLKENLRAAVTKETKTRMHRETFKKQMLLMFKVSAKKAAGESLTM